jgi:hypothetical protein
MSFSYSSYHHPFLCKWKSFFSWRICLVIPILTNHYSVLLIKLTLKTTTNRLIFKTLFVRWSTMVTLAWAIHFLKFPYWPLFLLSLAWYRSSNKAYAINLFGNPFPFYNKLFLFCFYYGFFGTCSIIFVLEAMVKKFTFFQITYYPLLSLISK